MPISKGWYQCTISSAMYRNFSFFMCLPILCIASLLLDILLTMKWHFIVILFRLALMSEDTERFSYAHWTFRYPLLEDPIKVCGPIFIKLSFFLSLICRSASYRLETSPLSDMFYWKYCLPVYRLPTLLFKNIFSYSQRQKITLLYHPLSPLG